ncbi:amidohydrolase [Brevibacterium album]|uniref:amidohydrolase n=1 Tax=Brevibacterium album TaxID=417948 RepID=UPI000405873C|nr:amidohydrolase [Brevibacterium album]
MTLPTTILDDLAAGMDDLETLYREFHQMPELSMEEHRTAEKISEHLRGLGLEPFLCGGTGVVAELRNGEGPVVAYRADTDGLPIEEDTGLPYASTATGVLPDGTETKVMHGCGHDTHISTGLELARLLTEHRDAWSGTVVFLFQPGEETSAGAVAMVEDDLWDRVSVPEVAYGQHVWPGVAGTVNVSVGTAMAMADSLEVTVHGRQAHGSQPEASIDPIVLGAHMVTRLQTVVSREISGSDMAVVTVGTFHAGTKENIIPDRAVFKINIRTFEPAVRDKVLEAVKRILEGEALASGAPAPTVREMYRFPRCFNDEAEARSLIGALRAELGEDAVRETPPVTGSEDFGVFPDSLGIPGVYWFFGGYSAETVENGIPGGNHSPFFGPDDVRTSLTTSVRAGLTAILSRVGV